MNDETNHNDVEQGIQKNLEGVVTDVVEETQLNTEVLDILPSKELEKQG